MVQVVHNTQNLVISRCCSAKNGYEMNGSETGTVQYSTELAFNSDLKNLIVLNVAFYMHLIRQFDSAHVKCDVLDFSAIFVLNWGDGDNI